MAAPPPKCTSRVRFPHSHPPSTHPHSRGSHSAAPAPHPPSPTPHTMAAALSSKMATGLAAKASPAPTRRGAVKVMAKTVGGKTVSGKTVSGGKTVKGGAAKASSDLTPGQQCEFPAAHCARGGSHVGDVPHRHMEPPTASALRAPSLPLRPPLAPSPGARASGAGTPCGGAAPPPPVAPPLPDRCQPPAAPASLAHPCRRPDPARHLRALPRHV